MVCCQSRSGTCRGNTRAKKRSNHNMLNDKYCLIVFIVVVGMTTDSDGLKYRTYQTRDYDFYGEFYRDSHGLTVYVYCFDPSAKVEDDCRQRQRYRHEQHHHKHISEYPGGVSVTNYVKSQRYHYYDGRQNVNVGHGRVYWRGRDVFIECRFPRRDHLISNIVWYRKRFHHGHDNKRSSASYNRYHVERFGNYGSRLVIRDYSAYHDDGIYRCFATRKNVDSYKNTGKESIYKEVEVYKSYKG